MAGALGPDAVARVAAAAEREGFHALWVNDTPGGDALAALAAAAATTTRLVLATGVVPMDRRGPASLAAALSALPTERVVLGIGSGAKGAGALAMVRQAVGALRGSAAQILVGALGPRMRELAAREADGPLLSWLTPAIAARQADEARAVAPHTHAALYVRTALDADALGRLEEETARYASYPKYAANFARLGISAGDTVLGPEDFGARLAAYRDGVDEVVLRIIAPHDDVADYERFISDAAERCASAPPTDR